MVKSNEEILELINKIDKRVSKIEDKLEISNKEEINIEVPKKHIFNSIEETKTEVLKNTITNNKINKEDINFSFTKIISFLGIFGIIIGVLSLFFYAINKNWISPMVQILIGIIIGLVIYSFGMILHKKREAWSYFMIGGGLFIEFLSISFGVLVFGNIPKILGFILLTGFIIFSLILSLKFKSKIIAYYSMVGGFLIPILTEFTDISFFILSYLLILNLGLLMISNKFNWKDLRFISFLIESFYFFFFKQFLLIII